MDIHLKAKQVSENFHRAEGALMDVIIELQRGKHYTKFGDANIFDYVVKRLNHTEEVAAFMIRVANKCVELPELHQAIHERRVSVSKASRVTSGMNKETIGDIISHLEKNSARKTEVWLREKLGLEPVKSLKVLARDLERIRKAKTLFRDKKMTDADVVTVAMDLLYAKHDPVTRAERSAAKAAKPAKLRKKSDGTFSRRKSLPAAIKRAVVLRDKKKCRFTDVNGEECGATKYVDHHHIKPVAEGGEDTVENLVSLCSAHHDLVHQLELPMEDQRKWIDRIQEKIATERSV